MATAILHQELDNHELLFSLRSLSECSGDALRGLFSRLEIARSSCYCDLLLPEIQEAVRDIMNAAWRWNRMFGLWIWLDERKIYTVLFFFAYTRNQIRIPTPESNNTSSCSQSFSHHCCVTFMSKKDANIVNDEWQGMWSCEKFCWTLGWQWPESLLGIGWTKSPDLLHSANQRA